MPLHPRPLWSAATRLLAVLGSSLFGLCPPADGRGLGPTILTVDDDGPADFAEIAPAVAFAREDDVVLVAPGQYPGFTILGKGLRVLADGSGPVTISGTVLIRDLIGPQQVLLRGLSSPNGEPPLFVHTQSNLGRILIEDCWLGPRGASLSPFPGLLSQSDTSLAIVRSTVVGGTLLSSPSAGGNGQPALQSSGSNVWCYHSTFLGGPGSAPGGDGGPGIEASNFELFCGSCVLRGGRGGDGLSCSPPGDGGNGLDQLGFVTNARWRATRATGGAGGKATCSGAVDGAPGAAKVSSGVANTFTVIGRESRGFEVGAPITAGEPLRLEFEAPRGESVLTYIAPKLNVGQSWELGGVSLLQLPAQTLFAGTVPADGLLEFPHSAAMVPPGHAGAVFYLQSLFLPSGAVPPVLGPVSAALVLAP
ncbi:MAG: hypothetical protein AAFZ65_04545 [Planctomycetota bacterium]